MVCIVFKEISAVNSWPMEAKKECRQFKVGYLELEEISAMDSCLLETKSVTRSI